MLIRRHHAVAMCMLGGLTACGGHNYNSIDPNPMIGGLADRSVAQDTDATIDFTVSDADSGAAALTATATSSDAQLVTADNIFVGGSGTNRTIKITPTSEAYGETIITVRVVDPDNRVAVGKFKLSVNGVFVPVSTAVFEAFAVDEAGDPKALNGMTYTGDVDEDPTAFDSLL